MEIKNFSEKLSQYRQNRKMTQEEFASRIGVTAQAVSKWERGLSLPDISLLSDICKILNISADDMLQTEYKHITESGDIKQQEEVLRNLKVSELLVLLIGYHLVEAVREGLKTDLIHEKRVELAKNGILLPVVRIKDTEKLQPEEFAIQSYENVLYQEKMEDTGNGAFSYMVGKLLEIVSDYQNYAFILNREMVKTIVDHGAERYPTLINETVPEKISYGFLLKVFRGLLVKGKNINNLNKMIEMIDENVDKNRTAEEIVNILAEEI